MSVSTPAANTNSISAGNATVTMDRRRQERRDEAAAEASAAPANPRRKQQRRRHIDPTTCERDYSDHEVEFMKAMDDYKQSSGRMFPTCSEVLEVIRSLGYVQLTDQQFEQLGLEDNDVVEGDSALSEEEADELVEA
ncbi:hypothetical protein [Rhodopirellula sp. SWK7]|uniref:hypothetical protein n=1 Tax=Rhodopirellula sp. SWK7 TaxID=595460 RepID=UPI0002BFBA7D|nr:hypothetical protein [Rhodopirellula sp. SWK7]EMI41228.1 hypothetical protein RRSWK_06287 [Rhodopirellula sp. SWK7]